MFSDNWYIIAGLVVFPILLLILIRRYRSAHGTKFAEPTPKLKLVGRIVGALLLLFCAWLLYTEFQHEKAQRLEIEARPHTARILGYQISFPKKIPEGYDAGYVEIGYFFDPDGKEGRTRIANWTINPPQGNFEDGMQFMVNELASAGTIPGIWQRPPYWEKIVRTPVGIKEVAGLKFAVTKWTADCADIGVTKLSGTDYLAHDRDKLIGLRVIDSKGKSAASLLADSVLNTFQKTTMPKPDPKIKDSIGPLADGSVCIVHGGNDGTFKDPYAELIQP